jgi:selenocysteine lyase/cysteine desulfurase
MTLSRREWMAGAVGIAAQIGALNKEDQWIKLSQAFPVDRSIINLNHAGIGTCPQPVAASVVKRMWDGEKATPATIFSYGPKLEPIRRQLAEMLGSDAEEIAITRNATESLNAILLGIPLRAGDEVLTTTLDYWAMLDALEQRRERDGVTVRKIQIPTPCEDLSEIVRRFETAMGPRTRLILISHPINLNGQLFPVRDICRMAHRHGVEVVVDAAQSFALVNYKMADLECDYLGTSLHKWLQAPKGTGLLYIKREKIAKVWPLFASGVTRPKEDIRKFELYGTWPETILGIEDAVAFHNAIGAERKEARLRSLTHYWVDAVRQIPGIRFHTSFRNSCSITCVELDGVKTPALRNWLLEKHGILTMDVTRRTREFAGIRISPGLSNTKAELDRFAAALAEARRTLLTEK